MGRPRILASLNPSAWTISARHADVRTRSASALLRPAISQSRAREGATLSVLFMVRRTLGTRVHVTNSPASAVEDNRWAGGAGSHLSPSAWTSGNAYRE